MSDLRILTSHPVQYHAPLFRALANRGLKIEVGYYHAGTAGKVGHDRDFGLDIQWDVDLLQEYSYKIFLADTATYTFREQIKNFLPILAWVLKERTPILLMGWFVESIWLVWMLALLFEIPVLTLSETTPLSYAVNPKPAWRARLLSWLLRQSHASLYVGTRNRDFLSQMGVKDEHLFPVPYSVENERFSLMATSLLPQRAQLCSQYGLNPKIPTFLFCGKLIPKKHPLELLDAYDSAGLDEKAQLIFVGEGMLRPQLEQRIQASNLKNVRLLGFMNQSQMPKAYVLGEVLCLISDPTETWGLVVNEAMACGRPVLVSDVVGCAPDLVDETNGWVVPADDPAALARVLRQAYEERHLWEEKGWQSLKKISRHTYDAMADGVISALKCLKTD